MKRRVCILIYYFIAGVIIENAAFCDDYIITVDKNEVYDYMEPVTQDTILYNYGTINSDINTTDDSALDVYNYGTINGTIYADGGFVNQHIESVDAANKITVNDSDCLYVSINGVHDINLTDIINLGNAAKFNITHSSIIINDFTDWHNWDQEVVLDNTDTLIISDANSVHSGDIIEHINDRIDVQIPDLDPAYKISLSQNHGAWFINLIKDENYTGQLADEKGDLLRDLQKTDDPLINAINTATDASEIGRIIQLSYHFNPAVLIEPVKTINKFMMSNMVTYKNSLSGGLSGVYILSDKTDAYGFDINLNGKYDSVYLSAGFNFHNFKYRNDYNDFSGLMYGFNVGAKTYFDSFWIDGIAGMYLVNFYTGDIVYNNDTRHNPLGHVVNGLLNVGYNYNLSSGIIISPFINTSVVRYSVLDFDGTDYNVSGGGKVQYSFVTDNIRYEYSGAGAVGYNDDLYGSVKVGFISEIDNAGISIGFDVLKTQEETGYKISINGNITF